MTTPTLTNGALVARLREEIDLAQRAGHPQPGRVKLAERTGASIYAVRKALATMTDQPPTTAEELVDQNPGFADANISPSSQTSQDIDQPAPPSGRLVDHGSTGRVVAWIGFVFGSVMSIAANVLHTWLPAAHEPAGWSPGIAPQIGAAVWPIGLLLSVEVLSRVRWPSGWPWRLARFGGAGTVTLGSAIISYGHLRGVLLAWSYGPLSAAVGPLVLDGLMVVCGLALLAISRQAGT